MAGLLAKVLIYTSSRQIKIRIHLDLCLCFWLLGECETTSQFPFSSFLDMFCPHVEVSLSKPQIACMVGSCFKHLILKHLLAAAGNEADKSSESESKQFGAVNQNNELKDAKMLHIAEGTCRVG